MTARSEHGRLQTEANEELPAGLAGLEEVKKVSISTDNAVYVEPLLTVSKQTYEDAIENMKIQFAAISEEKAGVERELEPLHEERAKLENQAEEVEARKEEHTVSPSRCLPYCWDTNSSDRH